MKNNKLIYIMLIFTVCILNMFLTSCSNRAAKPAPEESEQEQKKAPDSLKELETYVLDIFDQLDKDEDDKKDETKITIESKTEIKTEEDKDSASNETKEETKQEVKKETADDKKWDAVNKKIKKIHKQWNTLQPEVVKVATPKKVIDDLSDTLNTLTTYAEAKDLQNTLFLANEVYRLIPDFMEQYKDKIPPDLKRMSYFIRDARYNGMINQWEKSASSITNLKSHWAIVKPQGKKEQEKQMNEVEFAILELERVIPLQNIVLIKLKSELALDNIKKLEESFER